MKSECVESTGLPFGWYFRLRDRLHAAKHLGKEGRNERVGLANFCVLNTSTVATSGDRVTLLNVEVERDAQHPPFYRRDRCE